jgi:hypothetical protein
MRINKKSKFYTPKPFKERAINFFKSLLFWKGRKKGIIHTKDIKWNDVKSVFFPKGFHKKYEYLGIIPWKEENEIFKAMEPLVIYMDKKAKPWWCPRWFLRFLHLFGSDNSIVRVRNWVLHDLLRKLTKGYMIMDYKTKWQSYDLRISIAGNDKMHWLADAIEYKFYKDGRKQDLAQRLSDISDKPKSYFEFWTLNDLETEWEKIQPNY